MLDSIQAEQGSSVYLSSISLEFLIPCPIASVYVYFDNLCRCFKGDHRIGKSSQRK